jgi:hypothetical protein
MEVLVPNGSSSWIVQAGFTAFHRDTIKSTSVLGLGLGLGLGWDAINECVRVTLSLEDSLARV